MCTFLFNFYIAVVLVIQLYIGVYLFYSIIKDCFIARPIRFPYMHLLMQCIFLFMVLGFPIYVLSHSDVALRHIWMGLVGYF